MSLSTPTPSTLHLNNRTPLPSFFRSLLTHSDSPETILVLRSILPFETLYLTRSTNRLNESVSSSFSVSSSLSSSFSSKPASAPAANEGMTAARAIVNELDAARFDPLLVRAVSKGTARAMALYIQKVEAMVSPFSSSALGTMN